MEFGDRKKARSRSRVRVRESPSPKSRRDATGTGAGRSMLLRFGETDYNVRQRLVECGAFGASIA